MKKQILVIHGGDTYKTYEEYLNFLRSFKIDYERFRGKKKWKDVLQEKLGNDFEVITPQMPNKLNAKYIEWKIWFEKLIPFLEPEVILVGHSLGGAFLVKYLSENDFPKKVRAFFLVSPPYGDNAPEYFLCDFALSDNLERVNRQAEEIFLYQSKDDPIVPYSDFEKYKKNLPNAKALSFKDRKHFNQEDFPELVKDIESIYKIS